MSRTSSTSAVALVVLVLTVTGAPAADAAERPSSLSITAACDTGSGEYQVDDALFNAETEPGSVVVETFEVDGSATTPPAFTPDPVPAGGDAVASEPVAGTSTTIAIEVQLTAGTTAATVSQTAELAGDCAAGPMAGDVSGTTDIPETCSFLEQLDAIRLGDPGEDPEQVLDQLQAAIDSFEAAAAVAPADVTGDIQEIAGGLTGLRDIVAVIAAQQGQPTPEQEEQLQAIQDRIEPAAVALTSWVSTNCADDPPASSPAATPIAAAPSFTG